MGGLKGIDLEEGLREERDEEGRGEGGRREMGEPFNRGRRKREIVRPTVCLNTAPSLESASNYLGRSISFFFYLLLLYVYIYYIFYILKILKITYFPPPPPIKLVEIVYVVKIMIIYITLVNIHL